MSYKREGNKCVDILQNKGAENSSGSFVMRKPHCKDHHQHKDIYFLNTTCTILVMPIVKTTGQKIVVVVL